MDWNGSLVMGSWENDDLDSIWNGAGYRELRERLRSPTLPPDHACTRCPFAIPNVKQALTRATHGIASTSELPVVGWEI